MCTYITDLRAKGMYDERSGGVKRKREKKKGEGRGRGAKSFDYRLFFSIVYFSCLAMSSFLFCNITN